MKPIFTFFLLVCMTKGYAQLSAYNLYPSSTVTAQDTVKAALIVVMPRGSASKQSSSVILINDTILYKACFYKGGVDQMETYIPDTVVINPLSSGVYTFRIHINRTEDFSDDFCDSIQYVQTRIYDTLITVFGVNSVAKHDGNSLNVNLKSANSIEIQAVQNAFVDIKILDATGRVCYTTKREISTGKNVIDMDVPEQLAGMYFYHIDVGEQRYVKKFVKQ